MCAEYSDMFKSTAQLARLCEGTVSVLARGVQNA